MTKLVKIGDVNDKIDGNEVTIRGFLQDTRALAKVSFLIIRDFTGIIQAVIKKDNTEHDKFKEWSSIPRESVIEISGTVKVSSEAKSGVEIITKNVSVLSKAEIPLPIGIVDKVDVEFDTRLNNRFLDVRKERNKDIFVTRSYVYKYIREFLLDNGFIEIDTPKLVSQGAEGGATLFSVDYFGKKAYLAQSPQLYKQMAMAAGLEKVFELAHAFRAEPSDTVRHVTEFTSLDVEMSYINSSEEVMNLLEKMTLYVINNLRNKNPNLCEKLSINVDLPQKEYPKITYSECLKILSNEGFNFNEIDTEAEKKLGDIISKKYRSDFFFITEFPVRVKKGTFYAMRLENNKDLTGYFDLEFRGIEITSGGQREHRIDKLLLQIEEAGLSKDSFKDYLNSFRYGMPSHGGFGFGVDRFVQQLVNASNVREVVMFPRDRYRLIP